MSIQTLKSVPSSDLYLSDIQGDILIGLQKDAEVFLFFEIEDVSAFKVMLPALAALVTSCEKTMEREGVIRRAKASQSNARLDLLGLNIGFTAAGLGKLLGDENFGDGTDVDPAFLEGAPERADSLGDDTDIWLEGFTSGRIDGVLLVTGPEPTKAEAHAATILQALGNTVSQVYAETGKTRPQRGHEAFGFLDGVSQPGIRGLTQPQNPMDPEQGLPGQDLIHPGEFVFGYPGQADPEVEPEATKEMVGPVAEPPLPWMRDGSYMVFRRLEQKVLTFRAFLEEEAANLGMDKGLLAARMVGRWPSGAPLVLAPLQDDFGLGADKMANNDFEFLGPDPMQRRCPYAAHIRKTYPRDDINEAGVQTRRLRRAGIPFGEEVDEETETRDAEGSRGLMFVCYQTSITDQFEFVQNAWANNPDFVFGKTRPNGGSVRPGHDPIIGQVADNQRTMDEPIPNYPVGDQRSALGMTQRFVNATGAAYFFMPSISALSSAPLA